MEDKMMKGGECGDGACGGMCGGYGCKCIHHRMFPILVILFGATFLAGALGYLPEETVGVIWPVIVILAGLKKLFAGMCKCC